MSGAAFLITIPLFCAALVYALRRSATGATFFVIGLLSVLLGFVWLAPIDIPLNILGSNLEMGRVVNLGDVQLQFVAGLRPFFSFLYFIAAIAILFAWRLSQGRTFFAAVLAVIGIASLSMMVRPIALAPLGLAFMACLAVFVVQSGRFGSTRGAFRQLWFPIAAFPLFLAGAWFIQQLSFNPDDQISLTTAVSLFGWGLVLLLAPTPLHGPRVALTAEAPPIVAAFLQLVAEAVVLYLVRVYTQSYVDIINDFNLARYLILGALLTAVWSGIASFGQTNFSRLWSYANLYNYSLLLLAVGLGLLSSWSLVFLLFGARTILLLIGAMSLAVLRQQATTTEFSAIGGLASRLPWTTMGLLTGGLGLLGFPLTAGFASQWVLVQQIIVRDVSWLLVFLPAGLLITVAYFRGLTALTGKLVNPHVEREPRLVALMIAVSVFLSVMLGIAPQILDESVRSALAALATLAGN